tara:strand:- start:92 stop:682 length:591 start_codon:yes stop_codon:yes gene_type:complete
MRFYGKEKQDMFAYYLIGDSGTFLDIGCYHSFHWNNTAALEEIGWNGLMFDIREKWVDMAKSSRKSPVFLVDVSTDQFSSILSDNLESKCVDYISLDADEGSLGALHQILDNGFSFKCMTFEHDFYQNGDKLKAPSKEILERYGYKVLFENNKLDDGKIWEDWWINPEFFDDDIFEIATNEEYYSKCVYKLMEYRI